MKKRITSYSARGISIRRMRLAKRKISELFSKKTLFGTLYYFYLFD